MEIGISGSLSKSIHLMIPFFKPVFAVFARLEIVSFTPLLSVASHLY